MLYDESVLPLYEVISESEGTQKVWKAGAHNILEIARKYDITSDPLVSVKLIEAAVHVLSPSAQVAFTTAVSPSGTGTAYPAAFTVDAGDSVIFTAVPSSGYIFDRWTRNGSVLSESNPAQIPVMPLAAGESSVVYTAVLIPA